MDPILKLAIILDKWSLKVRDKSFSNSSATNFQEARILQSVPKSAYETQQSAITSKNVNSLRLGDQRLKIQTQLKTRDVSSSMLSLFLNSFYIIVDHN